MIIKWFEDAMHDLQALRYYIAQDNPAAANRVAKKILNIIPYRVNHMTIEILRVFHGAMQWPEEFSGKIK